MANSAALTRLTASVDALSDSVKTFLGAVHDDSAELTALADKVDADKADIDAAFAAQNPAPLAPSS